MKVKYLTAFPATLSLGMAMLLLVIAFILHTFSNIHFQMVALLSIVFWIMTSIFIMFLVHADLKKYIKEVRTSCNKRKIK